MQQCTAAVEKDGKVSATKGQQLEGKYSSCKKDAAVGRKNAAVGRKNAAVGRKMQQLKEKCSS